MNDKREILTRLVASVLNGADWVDLPDSTCVVRDCNKIADEIIKNSECEDTGEDVGPCNACDYNNRECVGRICPADGDMCNCCDECFNDCQEGIE